MCVVPKPLLSCLAAGLAAHIEVGTSLSSLPAYSIGQVLGHTGLCNKTLFSNRKKGKSGGTPLTPAHRRQRQEDLSEFEPTLVYSESQDSQSSILRSWIKTFQGRGLLGVEWVLKPGLLECRLFCHGCARELWQCQGGKQRFRRALRTGMLGRIW